MYACKDCGLAFDQVDNNGRCEGCAAAATAQNPPQQQGESEVERLRREQQVLNQRFDMLQGTIQQQQQQPQVQQSQADVNKQIWANPAQAIDYMATQRAAQAAQQMMSVDHDTMVEQAKRLARDASPEVWEKYAAEIEMRVAQNPPIYHRNVNLWKEMATRVAGEHWRELARDEREAANADKPKAPAIRTGGPAAPSPRSAPAIHREEELDPLAKEIAKKMRLDEGKMRQAIKNYANQGSESDPTVPSSWDEVFTFGPGTGPNRKQGAA